MSKAEHTELAQAALELDAAIREIHALGHEMGKISLESERGLDRAHELLARFDTSGQGLGVRMQNLAKALDNARVSVETVTQQFAESAVTIQKKQQEKDALMERYSNLANMVSQINNQLSQLRPEGKSLSFEERNVLASRMGEFDQQMTTLINSAAQLKQDAQSSSMKQIERHADSLRQSLQSAQHRIHQLVDSRPAMH